MFDFLKNPILRRLLASGVRAAFVWAGAWLVAREYANDAEVASLIASASPVVVSLLWSLYEGTKINERIETALDLPSYATKDDLDAALKAKREPYQPRR